MKKKLKWYSIEKGKESKAEKIFRRKAKSLLKLARKFGFNYAEIYYINADDSATINFRAKKNDNTVVNSYAFVREN